MKNTRRLLILCLSLASLGLLTNTSAQTTLSQQLARCAALGNDQERLACFDQLSRTVSANTEQSQYCEFIQPPATFLDSSLVTEAWKKDYSLTIRSFVDLIAHAVMENHKHVTVQGWSRDKQDYVLHITMRKPIKLYFFPRPATRQTTPMSLLRDVTMYGYLVGAEQFVVIIAAMVPDEEPSNANPQIMPSK